MKPLALLICFALLQNILYAQAKQLNELFSKYAAGIGYKPFAAQRSRLLLIPDRSAPNVLGVIKWQDLSEGRIEVHYNGNVVKVALIGKINRYVKCSNTSKAAVRFLGKSYKAIDVIDQIYMFLSVDSSQLPGTIDLLKDGLSQLNNTPVSDTNYHDELCFDCGTHKPQQINQHMYVDEITSEIVICYDNDKQPYHFFASNVRKAKKLTLDGLTVPSGEPISIASFDVYIVKPADTSHISNFGGTFNDELLAIIRTLEPGDLVIFDIVFVRTADGTKRGIQVPGFKVE